MLRWAKLEVTALGRTCASETLRCTRLQEYVLTGADVWFLRFSLDYHFEYMAVGNRTGKVFVYDIFKSTQILQRLAAPGLKSPVRCAGHINSGDQRHSSVSAVSDARDRRSKHLERKGCFGGISLSLKGCFSDHSPAVWVTQIRQTAVSYDGRTILCSSEDSTIYRWDAVSFQNSPEGEDQPSKQPEGLSADCE